MESLKKLLDYQKAIADLQYTINLLSWELRVSAPKKSEDNLSDLITYHESKLFELQTSEHYGALLKEVINDRDFKNIEEPEQRYIRNLLKYYEESKKVPSEFL